MNNKTNIGNKITAGKDALILKFLQAMRLKGSTASTIKNYSSDLNSFSRFLKIKINNIGAISSNLTEAVPFIQSSYLAEYKNYLNSKFGSASSVNRKLSSLRVFGKYLNDIEKTDLDFSDFLTNIPVKSSGIEALIKQYKSHLESKKVSFNTTKNYVSDLRNFLSSSQIDFSEGPAAINKITDDNIKSYINKSKIHSSASTVERRISSLNKYFKWAKKTGISTHNPLASYMAQREYLPTRSVKAGTDSRSEMKERIIARFTEKPRLQKALSTVLYTRPNWYNRYHSISTTRYFHLSILIIFAAAIGFGIYDQFFAKTQLPVAYPAEPTPPNKYLSFQGRLTNEYNTPIAVETGMVFKLYDAESAGSVLWNSAGTNCDITPDQDGIFSLLLGTELGTGYDCTGIEAISDDVFSENNEVWLDITVDSEAMSQRIQIATVAYALNSQTLQGFPITATGSATASTVLTMNAGGQIVLAEIGPKVKSVSGNFALEGEEMTLQTLGGSGIDGDITLSPVATGTVNILASGDDEDSFYLANASVTSGALIHGYYGGVATDVDLLSLGSGASETTKFLVESSGDTFIATGSDLHIGGYGLSDNSGSNSGASLTGLYDDSMTHVNGNTTVQGAIKELDTAIIGVGSSNFWQKNSTILSPATITDSLSVGTTTPSTAILYVPGSTNNNAWFNLGTGGLGVGTTTPANEFQVMGSMGIGSTVYNVAAPSNGLIVEGNVGIGTTAPSTMLHILKGGTPFTFNSGTVFGLQNDTTTATNAQMSIISGNAGIARLNLSDTDTEFRAGIRYDNSAETLILRAAGADHVTILSSGNVGIGTTSPGTKLGIVGGVGIGTTDSFANAAIAANNLAVQGNVGIGVSDPLSALDVRSGNVGIGTTMAAAYKLDVNGDIRIVSGSELYSYGSATLGDRAYTDENYVTDGQTFTASIDALDIAVAGIGSSGITGVGTSSYIPVWSSATSQTNSSIYFDGTNIGIGTTSPLSLLHIGSAGTPGSIDGTDDLYVYDDLEVDGTIYGSIDGYTSGTGTLGYLPYWDTTSTFANSGVYYDGTNIGIGTTVPTKGKLNVLGSVAIGSTAYTETAGAAPTNGLIVEGNVGIGTTAPDEKLDISGTTQLKSQGVPNPSGTKYYDSHELKFQGAFLDPLNSVIYDYFTIKNVVPNPDVSSRRRLIISHEGSASQSITLTDLGNVGIGTTSPGAYKLDVNGTSYFNGALTVATGGITVTGNSTITGTLGSLTGLTSSGSITFSGLSAGGLVKATAGTGVLGIASTGVDYEVPLTFSNGLTRSTNNVKLGGTLTQLTEIAMAGFNFAFSGSGNVGIGTTAPKSRLEIYGNDNLTSQLKLRQELTTSAGGGGLVLHHNNASGVLPSTNDRLGYVLFGTTDGSNNRQGGGLVAFADGDYSSGSLPTRFSFETAPTGSTTRVERMTIDSTGNVGIGTTSPGTKLSVVGGIGIGTTDSFANAAIAANNLAVQGSVGIGTTSPLSALDVRSGNVGIGTTMAATQKLDIQGNMRLTGAFYDYFNDPGTAGYVLTSGGVGVGTTWAQLSTLPVGNADTLDSLDSLQFLRSDTSDNFTSGTLTFDSSTELDMASGSTLDINGILAIGSTAISFDGASTDLAITGNLSFNTNDIFIEKSTGYIGIGTTAPLSLLHIGSAGTPGSIDGTDDLYVYDDLEVDGTIYGSIDGYTSGTGTIGYLPYWDTTSTFANSGVYYDGTNIGIGTTVPTKGKLNVLGSVAIGSTAYTETAGAAPTNGLIVEGNVGIGTTGPIEKLHIVNSSGASKMVNTSTGGPAGFFAERTDGLWGGISAGTAATTFMFKNGGSFVVYEAGSSETPYTGSYSAGTSHLQLNSGGNFGIGGNPGTAKLYVGGNVGIGTTSPLQKLQVAGDINIESGSGVRINNTATSGQYLRGDGTRFVSSAIQAGDLPAITAAGGWTDDGDIVRLTTVGDRVGIGTTSVHANTKLGIVGGIAIGTQGTFADKQAPTNGLIVEGNVGIGTTGPSRQFTVNENTNGGIISLANSDASIVANQTVGILEFATANESSLSNVYTVLSSIESASSIDITGTGNIRGYLSFSTNFNNTLSEKMRIDSAGNVGIGTTSPGTKLGIVGGVGIGTTDSFANAAIAANNLAVQGNVGIGVSDPLSALDVRSGNVGIGTTMAAAYKLDVNGDIRIVSGSELYSYGSATLGDRAYTDENYVTDGQTFTASIDALDIAVAGIGSSGITGVGTSSYIPVWSSATSQTNSSIYFDGTNIGIGTTSPLSLLHIGSAGTPGSIDGTDDLYVYDDLEVDGTIYGSIDGYTSGTGTLGYLPYWDTTSTFADSGLFYDGAANVGIGTTVPTKGKLNVLGSVAIGSTAYTETAGAAPTNGLIVEGNVGIGITNPSYAMEIGSASTPQLSFLKINPTMITGDILGSILFRGTDSDARTGAKIEAYAEGNNWGTNTNDAPTQLRFYTQSNSDTDDMSAPAMMISTGRRVGIGTVSPDEQLEVYLDNPSYIKIASSQNDAGIKIASDDTGEIQLYSANNQDDFRIYVNSADRFTIDATGLIGIGTTSPKATLGIAGGVGIGTTDSFANAAIAANNLAVQGSIGIGTTSPLSALDVRTGNVGIGTTMAATQKLDIMGSMRLDEFLYDENNSVGTPGQVLSTTASGTDWIDFSLSSAGGWTDDGDIVRLTTVGDRVGIGTTSVHANTKLGVLGAVAIGSQTYSDAQAPSNGLIVEGNVGIGTTSPGKKLDVNSSTGAQAIFSGYYGTANSARGQILIGGNAAYQGSIGYDANGYLAIENTYNNNDGDIRFRTKTSSTAVNVMTLKGSGNVGIGTTNPSSLLHLYSSSATVGTIERSSGASSALEFKNSASSMYAGLSSAENFAVGTSNDLLTTGILTVTSTGYVGVGTGAAQSVVSPLHLSYTSSGTHTIISNEGFTVENNQASVGSLITFRATNSDSQKGNIAKIGALSVGGSGVYDGEIVFSNRTSGSMYERMRIDHGGNVGIGTTNPLQKLQVAGDINIESGSGVRINNTATSGQYLRGDGTRFVSSAIQAGDLPAITAAGGWTDDGDIVRLTTVGDRVGIGTTSVHANTKLGIVGGIAIGTQGTYADKQAPTNGLIVEGNVGIGTTSPSQKLDIRGNLAVLGTSDSDDDYLYFDTGTSEYLMWDDDPGNFILSNDLDINNHLALGAGASVNSNKIMYLYETLTDTSSTSYGAHIYPIFNFTASTNIYNTSGLFVQTKSDDIIDNGYSVGLDGIKNSVTLTSGTDIGTTMGIDSVVTNELGSTASVLRGVYSAVSNSGNVSGNTAGGYFSVGNSADSSGSIYGVHSTVSNSGVYDDGSALSVYNGNLGIGTTNGSINKAKLLNLNLGTNNGTITSMYGVYLGSMFGGTQTNVWGIWADAGDWILDEDGNGVSGGSSGGGDLILGEGQDFEFYHDGTNSYIVNNTGYLSITDSGTDSLVLQSNGGNVGIGTTSPGTKLGIVGGVGIGTTDSFANAAIAANNLAVQGSVGIGATSPLSALDVRSGNVGIGTTMAATQKLDIQGNMRLTGAFYDGSNSAGLSNYYLQSTGTGTQWTDMSSVLLPSGTDGQTLYYSSGWAATSNLFNDGTNVGIGTTAPGEKFTMVGGNFLHTASGNPTLEGTYNTSGDAYDVYVSGKYAYVADYGSGLQVIDISDPSTPTLEGTYNTSGNAYGVYVSGKYAYVADGGSGLQVIDISDPSTPTLEGTYNTSGNAFRLYVSGKYAYVADYGSGLQVIDISDPNLPVLVGTYATGGNARSIYISGKYAYVGSSDSNLYILDISNPSSPSLITTYSAPSWVRDVYVSGKYAYIAILDDSAVIVDVSNPSSPSYVGSIGIWATSLYISGKYAYLGGYHNFNVFDISDPSLPFSVGAYSTSGNGYRSYVSGKYAYVADGGSGLQIIDINGIDTPSISTGNIASNDITVWENMDVGNNLYVRNGVNIGPGGLYVDAGEVAFDSNSSDVAFKINQKGTGDIFRVFDDATQVFTIRDGGNVGIGTTSPGTKLGIVGGVGIGTTDSFANAAIAANNLAVQGSVGIGTTSPLSALDVRSGNVGIGTTMAATQKLDINGGLRIGIGATNQTLQIGNVANVIYNRLGTSSATQTGNIESNDDLLISGHLELDGTLWLDGNTIANSLGTEMIKFYTGSSQSIGLINYNVGIGTTSPGTKLGIVGGVGIGTTDSFANAAIAANNLAVQGSIGIGTTSPVNKLQVIGSVGIGSTAYNVAAPSNGLIVEGNVGIGTTSPTSLLHLYSTSTSTAFTGFNLDWQPGSSTTLTGDLFSLNIGPNGNLTNIFNVKDNGTSLFSVSESVITSAIPHQFTSAGDVSIAYDAVFTNQTASQIESYGPFSIIVGESWESNDLTLKTYNSGDIILESGSGNLWVDGTNVGIGTTSPVNELQVLGSVGIGTTVYNVAAPTNGLIVEGNVGIGTTAPGTSLSIAGGVGIGTTDSFANAAIAANNLAVQGSLGVGITNPSVNLHLYTTDSNMKNVFNEYVADGVGGPAYLGYRAKAGKSSELVADDVISSFGGYAYVVNATGWKLGGLLRIMAETAPTVSDNMPAYLSWTSYGSDDSYAERFRITSLGNVGIGTTAPGGKLGVVGGVGIGTTDSFANAAIAANNLAVQGSLGVGITNPSEELHVYSSSLPSAIVSDGSRTVGIGVTTDNQPYVGTITNSGFTLRTNATERIRITATGNVGIGTSVPTKGKLSVLGSVAIGSTAYTEPSGAAPTNGLIVEGNVGIGTTAPSVNLHVGGYTSYSVTGDFSGAYPNIDWATGFATQGVNTSILADGALVANGVFSASDQRLKENIDQINPEMVDDFMQNIVPVGFNWKEDGLFSTGFVAQDLIRKGFGYLVKVTPNESIEQYIDESGFISPAGFQYNVDYQAVVPILTLSLQKQQAEISSQSNQLSLLKKDLSLTGTGDLEIAEKDDIPKSYELKDSSGNTITRISAFAEIVVANIKAGVIEAANITTGGFVAIRGEFDNLLVKANLISPSIKTAFISPVVDETNINIQIGDSKTGEKGKLAIINEVGEEVASIDSSGNAFYSGTIASKDVETNEVRTDRLIVDEIIGKDGLKFGEQNSDSNVTLEEIEALLKEAEINNDLLSQTDNWNTNTATDSASLTELALEDLYVTGQAAISSLSVSNSISLGFDMVISSLTNEGLTENSINTLSSPLSIQSLAMAPVEIMAGKFRIDTNGDVMVEGNMYLAGKLESSSISVRQSSQEEYQTDKLISIVDKEGLETAVLTASGSAQFKDVSTDKFIIAGATTEAPETNIDGELETNATAGKAVIKSGLEEITINNPSINQNTFVYVTPTSSTKNYVLYVKAKGDGFVKVGFTRSLDVDVEFNWWIIEASP